MEKIGVRKCTVWHLLIHLYKVTGNGDRIHSRGTHTFCAPYFWFSCIFLPEKFIDGAIDDYKMLKLMLRNHSRVLQDSIASDRIFCKIR